MEPTYILKKEKERGIMYQSSLRKKLWIEKQLKWKDILKNSKNILKDRFVFYFYGHCLGHFKYSYQHGEYFCNVMVP